MRAKALSAGIGDQRLAGPGTPFGPAASLSSDAPITDEFQGILTPAGTAGTAPPSRCSTGSPGLVPSLALASDLPAAEGTALGLPETLRALFSTWAAPTRPIATGWAGAAKN